MPFSNNYKILPITAAPVNEIVPFKPSKNLSNGDKGSDSNQYDQSPSVRAAENYVSPIKLNISHSSFTSMQSLAEDSRSHLDSVKMIHTIKKSIKQSHKGSKSSTRKLYPLKRQRSNSMRFGTFLYIFILHRNG